ncbi:hypothetical protein UFOVP238_47 [uncultured Caudovirales phage]|uniref:Uncharacterized protein n=1 Tax=uncultured Caudovirales phage TaxID=2100421 RepID=A0A6J7WQT9_9CAUD|nr:hypothetical protein UFOVP238_47 [uncultured Caudovirales phage]
MPTFSHGRNTKVLFGVYDISAYLKQASPSSTIDTPETTAFGSTNKSYVTGITDGKISASGMFDGSSGAVDSILQNAFGQASPNPLIVAPQGLATVGERCWMLNTILSSYSVTASVSDMVGISADFQGTSNVKTGPVLSLLSTANTVSATSTTINSAGVNDRGLATATSFGGFGILMIQTNSTNQAVTVKIEHAPDSSGSAGSWTQLLAFTAVSAGTTSAQLVALSPTASINPWLRVTYTNTAGTGTFNAHVSFARNTF